MAYLRACAVDEVPDDQGLGVTLDGLDVVVARCGEEFFALQDVCSHAEVALSEGEIDGVECSVECWLHGSMFDLRTGKPTNLPATEPVSTFPVEVRDGAVYVDVATTLNGVAPS